MVKKFFNYLTYYLGINFCEPEKHYKTFVCVQLLIQSYSILTVFFLPKLASVKILTHGIYALAGLFQYMLPYFVQNFLIVRAFLNKKQQNNLRFEKFCGFDNGERERNFLFRVLVIILIRIVKYIWGYKSRYATVFTSQTNFSELTYSANDLMFVYHLEALTRYLELVDESATMARSHADVKQIKQEICEIFIMKKKLMNRYGLDIFITTVYNFVLLIISMYWVLMRVYFNLLKTIGHYWTFLHFLEPCFIFWIVFSRCDKFTNMVRSTSCKLNLNDILLK